MVNLEIYGPFGVEVGTNPLETHRKLKIKQKNAGEQLACKVPVVSAALLEPLEGAGLGMNLKIRLGGHLLM